MSFWPEDFDPFAPGFKPADDGAVIHYSLAFVFDDNQRVALIEKQRPSYLRGKWNGIGGKYELEDESLEATASRELYEEASLHLTLDELTKFAVIASEAYVVHVYVARVDEARLNMCWANTDEDVLVCTQEQLQQGFLPIDQDAQYLLKLAQITLKGELVQAVIRR